MAILNARYHKEYVQYERTIRYKKGAFRKNIPRDNPQKNPKTLIEDSHPFIAEIVKK